VKRTRRDEAIRVVIPEYMHGNNDITSHQYYPSLLTSPSLPLQDQLGPHVIQFCRRKKKKNDIFSYLRYM
jgi:hypothetical protein